MITEEEKEILMRILLRRSNYEDLIKAAEIIKEKIGKKINPHCQGCFNRPIQLLFKEQGIALPKNIYPI